MQKEGRLNIQTAFSIENFLFQRLHTHNFHQEVGKRRIAWLGIHVFPTLLPTAQSTLDILFGLLGSNLTTLAVNGGTQINFIHTVIDGVASHLLDTEAVQILGCLNFGQVALAHLGAQAACFIMNLTACLPLDGLFL